MKKYLLLVLALYYGSSAIAQSPYSLSPDWYFGIGGRATFTNGNFPNAGAPAMSTMPTNNSVGVEASTSICFRSGAVALYTNTQQAYNANPANAGWTDYIRSFTADNTCSGSATGGAVAFPDPASPTNAFYLILANDLTSGSCANQGMHQYRFTGTGIAVNYSSGPSTIASATFASEAVTVGSDGAGGYWLVTHAQTAVNTFRVWHYTSTGISASTDYTVGAATPDVSGSQSYLKISPCQDKIAYTAGGTTVVHNFNRTTGVVGAELDRYNPGIGYGVGLEFSPDGSKIYYSGQGTVVGWFTIGSSGTSNGTVAGSASWSLQMGPDAKIYTSPSGATNLGVISNANTAPSYTTTASMGGASLFRGLSNIAWLNPQTPSIAAAATATCNVYNFSTTFKNYFNANVALNGGSFTWDFGDGTGSHTGLGASPSSYIFPPLSGGPYTVTATFTDASCGQTWTATTSVTVTCPAPVELLSFTGIGGSAGADLAWQTAMELNNDYFDLQRSIDGVNFQSVTHVKGAGTSSSLLLYQYRDTEVNAGLVYYKLVQHDYDGTQTSSKIITIRFDNSSSIPVIVAPNPFSSSFVLSKKYMEAATISVYDVYGRVLEQKTTTTEESAVSLGESLANGSYILQYLSGSNAYTIHVEKK